MKEFRLAYARRWSSLTTRTVGGVTTMTLRADSAICSRASKYDCGGCRK